MNKKLHGWFEKIFFVFYWIIETSDLERWVVSASVNFAFRDEKRMVLTCADSLNICNFDVNRIIVATIWAATKLTIDSTSESIAVEIIGTATDSD